MKDRNRARTFAERTRKNLDFIESAGIEGKDVHRVVQITLSLLGLVVFPKEKLSFDSATKYLTLSQMEKEGWFHWKISCGKEDTNTLYDLIYHLRNAAAHGLLKFETDSREPCKEWVVIADAEDDFPAPNWRARIRADELREFCIRLMDFIEDI